jgi:probable phosphoglycerate mutase
MQRFMVLPRPGQKEWRRACRPYKQFQHILTLSMTHPPTTADPAMTTRIAYLARHGETDWNRERRWQGQTDIALNAAGRAQAEDLAAKVERSAIEHVHTSDLSRARETAEIVARRLGLGPVAIDPDLRERNFGVFEGLTFAECAEKLPEMWARYVANRTRPEGSESDQALAERMIRGVTRAVLGDGIALVVTHGGAMRACLRAMGVSTGTDDFAMPNGALIRVDLELRSGAWVAGGEQP